MNAFGGECIAEFDNTDRVGHEICTSVERFHHDLIGPTTDVWLSVNNVVMDEHGIVDPTLYMTPSQARDLAASLLIAADHADGLWDER